MQSEERSALGCVLAATCVRILERMGYAEAAAPSRAVARRGSLARASERALARPEDDRAVEVRVLLLKQSRRGAASGLLAVQSAVEVLDVLRDLLAAGALQAPHALVGRRPVALFRASCAERGCGRAAQGVFSELSAWLSAADGRLVVAAGSVVRAPCPTPSVCCVCTDHHTDHHAWLQAGALTAALADVDWQARGPSSAEDDGAVPHETFRECVP